jgi:membrane protease YdiL (CAAX protease family)
MSDDAPVPPTRLPGGWITGLICGLVLIASFVLLTSNVVLSSGERWAAITTFSVLALLYTMQGSPGFYDLLGRTIRQDIRARVVLLSFFPTLYLTYSFVVGAFTWSGLLIALAFVALPALAFAQSRQQRTPTLFDLIAILYVLISLTFPLLPTLTLPPQDGVIGFFAFIAVPLVLVLLAARGWPGLGFTWFLSGSDLYHGLISGIAVLMVVTAAAGVFGYSQPVLGFPPVIAPIVDEFIIAVTVYFLYALPQEIFFRGMIQNGIARFAEVQLWRGPGSFQPGGPFGRFTPQRIALVLATLLFALAAMFNPVAPPTNPLLVGIAGLGYGWAYQQTGKVTVSAVAHGLVLWGWELFFM